MPLRFGIVPPTLYFAGVDLDGVVAPLSDMSRSESTARAALSEILARHRTDAKVFSVRLDCETVEEVKAREH